MTDSGQGSPLDIGKLPPGALQEWVLKRRGHDRAEVRLTAALGEDAAVLDLDDDWCVASVDPITGATSEIGWLAVHVSCNDVAAHGARPVAALLCVLLPEGSRSGDLAAIMEGAERAAREVEVAIVGGHTEVTPGLRQPIVTATVIGRVPRGRLLRSADLRPGDRVWMSKTAGLEGTAILAGEWADRLRGRVPDDQLAEAAGFSRRLSIVAEALAVCEAGATALHDVTEGGVLGALWEMAAAAGVGLEVWPDRIPVAPATRAICQALGLDPLRLISSGVLLAAAPADVDLTPVAAAVGVPLVPIAQALAPGEGLWLMERDGRRPLEPPSGDELWRIKADDGEAAQ